MSIADKLNALVAVKTALRTSINNKGGSIDDSTPFSEYSLAVDNISTGGSTAVSESGVRFYDYEGTLLHSYTVDEALALESLPTDPDRSQNTACNGDIIPLTFDGWNWTLEEIKTYLTNHPEGLVNVGANYHTTDDKTHIIFEQKEDKDFSSGVWFRRSTASGTVDWGDETTENNTSTDIYHTYDIAGIYDCVIDSSNTYVNCGSNSIIFSIKVKEVYLSSSITSIGSYAFSSCKSLQSVSIPNSVTSIGDSAFSSCSSLKSVTIPDSVTSIGSQVFGGCSSLQSVNIPDSVTSIGDSAFSECKSLQSITIPDGVTSIGSQAFYYCYSLQSITIPDGVTSIGGSAFNTCYSLQSITIPDGVTSIDNTTFYYCHSLQSISIPDSVTSIGSQVFGGCSSLQSVNIPDSVTSIGSQAFYSCSSLQSITIPDGVTSIDSNAFSRCRSLHTVFLKPTTPPTLGNNAFNTSNQKKFVVPAGTLADYQAATNWSTFTDLMVEATE